MKKKLNSNSGFTLIELIIAIAVLAFLMTAVSSMMGSSVMTNRKAQADLEVQTSAQETYNRITDAIMQAKKVYIFGYTYSGTPDFSKSGSAAGGSPAYFVAGLYDEKTYAEYNADGSFSATKTADANKTAIASDLYKLGYTVSTTDIKFFHEIAGKDIYVKKLIIADAETLDISLAAQATATGSDEWEVRDFIYGGTVEVKRGPGGSGYSETDTVVNIFTFDENKLYFEKKYAFMTSKNDMVSDWTDPDVVKRNIYSESLSYVTTDSDPLSGCVAKINPDKGSIAVDLYFNDKSMAYTSLGMINIRNSYVLKAKQ